VPLMLLLRRRILWGNGETWCRSYMG